MDKHEAKSYISSHLNIMVCPFCGTPITSCEHTEELSEEAYHYIIDQSTYIKDYNIQQVAGYDFLVGMSEYGNPFTVFDGKFVPGKPKLIETTLSLNLRAVVVGKDEYPNPATLVQLTTEPIKGLTSVWTQEATSFRWKRLS